MSAYWRTLPVGGHLFESARWLEPEECFQWVDILTAKIYRWRPATDAVEQIEIGFEYLPLATPTPASTNQLLAGRDALYQYRWEGRPEKICDLPVGEAARLNDGIVDQTGAVWIGSMALQPSLDNCIGRLWQVSGGTAREVLAGLGISNGIVWYTPRHGYHVDSLLRSVYTLRWDGRELARELAATFPGPGEPDGATLVGNELWVALWDGGALGRLDLAGKLLGELPLPAARPSSLAVSGVHVLVTTAGAGTGDKLDGSGNVLVADRDQLHGAG